MRLRSRRGKRNKKDGGKRRETKLSLNLSLNLSLLVGEHSVGLRRSAVRQAGGSGRDYVGISSANSDEKSGRRKPKVSWGREIRPGLVGPKARPRGVADG